MRINIVIDKMFTALGIEFGAWDVAVAQSAFGLIIWSDPPDEKLKREVATIALLGKPVIVVVHKGEELPEEVRAALNIVKEITYDDTEPEAFAKMCKEAIDEVVGDLPFVLERVDVRG